MGEIAWKAHQATKVGSVDSEFQTLQGVLNGGVGQIGHGLSGERHHGGSRLVLRSLHSIPEKAMFQMSESKPESMSCSKQNARKLMALTCLDIDIRLTSF